MGERYADGRAKCRRCDGPIGEPDGITGVGYWSHPREADCIDSLKARLASLTTVSEQDVERVARALCVAMGDDPDREAPERITAYDGMARAALTAFVEK